MSTSIDSTLRALQDDFLRLHTTKEDLFWSVKMGVADDPPPRRSPSRKPRSG